MLTLQAIAAAPEAGSRGSPSFIWSSTASLMTARARSRMSEAFSLAGYRSLLQAFAARNYEVRGFVDAEPDRPHLILRHDLDMSLDAALPVAEVEQALG